MVALRFKSLAAHIAAAILLATGVSLIVLTAAMLLLDRMSSIHALESRLATLADVIGQNSTAALVFKDKQAADEVLQALRQEPSIVSACLFDRSGLLFSEYHREMTNTRCMRQMPTPPLASRQLFTAIRPVYQHSDQVGSIWVTSDMREFHLRERRLLGLAAILAIFALSIGGIAGFILQRRISRPVCDLVGAMDRVSTGQSLDIRVKAGGSTEIVQLAAGFNTMLAELEKRDRMTRLAEIKLVEEARTDSLTGLPNRRYFMQRLTQALAQANRDCSLIGLLYIDLDGFKLVNDSLGHSTGDILLREVADRFNARVRLSDTLGRVGGDEFTVILTSLRKAEDAATSANALLDVLSESFHVEGHEITIGASIGISIDSNGQTPAADLLRQADSAMYAAKRGGRGRTVFFSPDLSIMARERLTIENQLRGAVARKEIYLHFQPEFDARSGDLIRFEALARWRHPQLGQVPPDKFIPIAEESGLIHMLGFYIMELACSEAANWQAVSPVPIQVAVNVSAVQFNSEIMVDEVKSILGRTGLDPRLLQIELTESVMIGSLERSAEKMNKLRKLGVSLVLDDFGTGFSSLSYLPGLPVDGIKIDRSFVSGLYPDSEAIPVLRTVIEMARAMNMRTIVEGIEHEGQLQIARQMGADEVQGFLLGRPAPNPVDQVQLYQCCNDDVARAV
jgi:diguanylate cyclase (GGDEF)-like protein